MSALQQSVGGVAEYAQRRARGSARGDLVLLLLLLLLLEGDLLPKLAVLHALALQQHVTSYVTCCFSHAGRSRSRSSSMSRSSLHVDGCSGCFRLARRFELNS